MNNISLDEIFDRLSPKLKTRLKLPKKGKYDFQIGVDDDLSSFDVPISSQLRLKQPPSDPEKEILTDNNQLAKSTVTLKNPNSGDTIQLGQ